MKIPGLTIHHLQKTQNRPRLQYGPVQRSFRTPALIAHFALLQQNAPLPFPGPAHRYQYPAPFHQDKIAREEPRHALHRLKSHLHNGR